MTDEDATDPDEAGSIGVAVVTISATLSLDADAAGDAVVAAFEDAGHDVATRELIDDGHDNVQAKVSRLIDRDDVDLIATVGGIGIAPDQVTPEAIRPLLDMELPAFADLYHRLSADAVGTRILSRRTLGGVGEGVPVFCLPADEDAARLGAAEIVVPEAPRLVDEATPEPPEEGP